MVCEIHYWDVQLSTPLARALYNKFRISFTQKIINYKGHTWLIYIRKKMRLCNEHQVANDDDDDEEKKLESLAPVQCVCVKWK